MYRSLVLRGVIQVAWLLVDLEDGVFDFRYGRPLRDVSKLCFSRLRWYDASGFEFFRSFRHLGWLIENQNNPSADLLCFGDWPSMFSSRHTRTWSDTLGRRRSWCSINLQRPPQLKILRLWSPSTRNWSGYLTSQCSTILKVVSSTAHHVFPLKRNRRITRSLVFYPTRFSTESETWSPKSLILVHR